MAEMETAIHQKDYQAFAEITMKVYIYHYTKMNLLKW